jgi:hypothetical protein
MVPEPTEPSLKYCGAAGKPDGKRRKPISTLISEETDLFDSKEDL